MDRLAAVQSPRPSASETSGSSGTFPITRKASGPEIRPTSTTLLTPSYLALDTLSVIQMGDDGSYHRINQYAGPVGPTAPPLGQSRGQIGQFEAHAHNRGPYEGRNEYQLHEPKRRRLDDGANVREVRDEPKPKRERCANACHRCKAKKLKCLGADGDRQPCLACAKAGSRCAFDSTNLKTTQLQSHVRVLEDRIATLESALAELDPQHPEVASHFNGIRSDEFPSNTKTSSPPAASGIRQILTGLIAQKRRRYRPTDPASLIQPITASADASDVNDDPDPPPAAVADKILFAVYHHIQSRYPFLDWTRIRAWEQRRDEVCHTPTAPSASLKDDQIGAFFVWMTYAVGAELVPDVATESPTTYLSRAMRYLDFVLQSHDLTTIRAMLYLVFFSFRCSDGPPLWFLSGFIMRLCLELYLHRERPGLTPFQAEERKRIFWTAYSFDRLISLASGRPVSIADNDIEISIPVDIDPDEKNPARIAKLQAEQAALPPPYAVSGELTTMSSAIHYIRHYRIRSRIFSVYAVRAERPSRAVIGAILDDLQEWRDAMPRQTSPAIPVQAEDRFEMFYFQSVLFALRQEVAQCDASDPLLEMCAMSAAQSCERGRKVHQNPKTKQAVCSLCFLFVSGVTLLYCLSINPTVIPSRTSSRALRSCTSTLAIYAQVHPEAAIPFRDLFEYFSDEVIGGGSASEPDTGDGKVAGMPTVEILKQVMLGEFSQLGAVYESLTQPQLQERHPAIMSDPPKPGAPLFNFLAPPPLAPDTGSSTAMLSVDSSNFPHPTPGNAQQMNCDLANLSRFGGDLASFLDISLDAPIEAWLGSWAQV